MSGGLLQSWAQRGWRFLAEDIWDIEPGSLSRARRAGIHLVRIAVLVFKGFRDNQCPLHAAFLTYSTLMALVPLLALALALLRGLGAGDWAEHRVLSSLGDLPAPFTTVVTRLFDSVRHTDFATLGGIGLLLLLWAAVQVLSCVEMSFNRVWGVSVSRRLLRKFSDYLSIVMVVPILMVAATTLNATLHHPSIIQALESRLAFAHLLYARFLSLLPLLATWVAFGFLYKLMPNTRVLTAPAVLSGIAGGSLWVGWQWVSLTLQVGISRYNAIYGTLASIPIFLFWLYLSWWIVLLGAEFGFALQNHATYKMEQAAHGASTQSRIMLALSILSHAAQAMMIRVPRFEPAAYARAHRIPVRLIHEVLDSLVQAELLAEVAEDETRYVLLTLPDRIRVHDVVNVMIQSGGTPRSLGLDMLNPAIRHVLGKRDAGAAEALKEFTLADLLKLHARLRPAPP